MDANGPSIPTANVGLIDAQASEWARYAQGGSEWTVHILHHLIASALVFIPILNARKLFWQFRY
jgi:hypothetical protein